MKIFLAQSLISSVRPQRCDLIDCLPLRITVKVKNSVDNAAGKIETYHCFL